MLIGGNYGVMQWLSASDCKYGCFQTDLIGWVVSHESWNPKITQVSQWLYVLNTFFK